MLKPETPDYTTVFYGFLTFSLKGCLLQFHMHTVNSCSTRIAHVWFHLIGHSLWRFSRPLRKRQVYLEWSLSRLSRHVGMGHQLANWAHVVKHTPVINCCACHLSHFAILPTSAPCFLYVICSTCFVSLRTLYDLTALLLGTFVFLSILFSDSL